MSLTSYRRSSALAAMAGTAYRNRGPIFQLGRSINKRARQFFNDRRSSKRQRSMRTRPMGSYSGQGVTSQHDVARIYRKRNMPRYKKRRWRRFVRQVHAVAEKDLGSRTVVFNTQLTQSSQTAGQQGVLTLGLYTQKSANQWLGDLNQIAAMENFEANPTTAAGITVEKSTKYMFQSGILDCTFKNTSFQNDNTTTGAKMEVDVYEIVMYKDAIVGTSGSNNLSSLINSASSDTKILAGLGTSCDIALRGCTPWDITYALSRYGIKLINKKKYFLEAGGTFTYQTRDPRRYSLDQNDMNDREGFARRKLTKIIYVLYKLVPGHVLGINPGEFTLQLQAGVTRKYFYKIEGANDDRDRYISASVTGVGNPN